MKRLIEQFLAKLPQKKIAVFGDIMLDKYYYSKVKKISPEAPVPIANVTGQHETLGGAANVANNLAKLGCEVYLIGLVGNDNNKEVLEKLLHTANIDPTGILLSKFPTITKARIIGEHQQMLRLDFEAQIHVSADLEKSIVACFDLIVSKGIDGVIISDYAKGVCTAELCRYIIETCHKNKIPILIDPKGKNWMKYSHATYITPNLKEISDVLGETIENEDGQVEKCAEFLKRKFSIQNVVITRSEKGLTLVNEYDTTHFPTQAKEVYDVSGAGDTVAAVLLAAIVSGFDNTEALQLANLAAGFVVGKVGTYPINRTDLFDMGKEFVTDQGKIVDLERLLPLVSEWKRKGETIVFTNGCFDILHVGHIAYLQKAKLLGKHLIVGINSDLSVKGLKGPTRPIVAEDDRAKMLAALTCVDNVIIFAESTPANLLKAIRPHVLVKGGDYRTEEIAGREYAERVEIIQFEDGYSTSNIIKKILAL